VTPRNCWSGTHKGFSVFHPRLYKDDVALYGSRYYYYIWELPLYVLMGVVGGLLGALFIRINVWVTALRARYVPPVMLKRRVAEVCTSLYSYI
jgi:chloride channel 7